MAAVFHICLSLFILIVSSNPYKYNLERKDIKAFAVKNTPAGPPTIFPPKNLNNNIKLFICYVFSN